MNMPRVATIILLLLLCVVGNRRFKSIVNPVVIVCAPWAGMLIGQQAFGYLFPFSATAAWLVSFAAVTFSLGALALSLHCNATPAPMTVRLQPRASLLWTAVGWSLIAATATNFAIYFYYGFVLGVGRLEGGGLLSYSLAETIQGSSIGWIQRGCQTAVYIGAGLFALDTVRLGRLGLRAGLFLGIVILHGWVISNRLPTFLTVSIFGLMWSLVYAHRLPRPSLRVVSRITLVLAVAGTFYWYTMSRRHSGQLPAVTLALDMATTFFGPPAAFSVHLEMTDGWRWGTLTGLTIEGPLELFGLAHRGWGQFDPISPIPGLAKLETNVFSGLAMLLDDVGVAGTGALLAMFGALTTALVASLYRRPTVLKTVVVANVYLLLFWMPVVLMSYYVFWWVQFLAVGLLGSLLFSSSSASDTSRHSQQLARA